MRIRTNNLCEAAGLEGFTGLKQDFRDRYELRAYLRSILLAKRLIDSPGLVKRGREFLEKFVRDDPRQRAVFDLWVGMLALPVPILVANLLADDERGALLRETAPVFAVISREEVSELARLAA